MFYDLHVPGEEHYLADGMWSHNTGKSVGGLTKLHLAAMKRDGFRGMIVRKTAASLGASTLDIWRKRVIEASLAIGDVTYYGGSTEEPPQYRYGRNGSKIIIGGLDKPSKIMSSEYDMIVADEATELFIGDWEALLTRLRSGVAPYSQVIGLCNPDAEHHWIYQRQASSSMTFMESRHEDNPAYYDARGEPTPAGAAYLAKLDKLTGVRYQRLRKGLWVAAEGLVYEDWDPIIHLVDALPEGSENWVRWWSVDFGHTNPFVLQCWAEDDDGRLWLYREIYMTKRLVEDHARQVMGIVAPEGKWIEPRPRAIICDHDAEDRATLERHLGMSTVAAKKSVSPGIQAFQARLRKADDGRPRVYVVRHCLVERDAALAEAGKPTCFVEEITGYVWAKGPDGKPAKEHPEKDDDHSCFVAGTPVVTLRGDVPIEAVRPGDRVLTRRGWREVFAAGVTDAAAPVIEVELSSGAVLTGTGSHPVWVEDRWVRLDTLRYGDTLTQCDTSSLRESRSVDIPSPRTGRIASTSRQASPTARRVGAVSTKRSGATRTATSPRVTTSTIATSTRSTTTSATCSASPSRITSGFTWRTPGSLASSASSPRLRGLLRPSGTAAMPAESGTRATRSQPGRSVNRSATSASSAAPATRRSRSTVASVSAPTPASLRLGAHRVSMTSIAPARRAVRRSGSTATAVSSRAVVRVVRLSPLAERQPVYNLTVAGEPEYFAAGVLVHNCDAARYLIAERDMGGRPGMRALRRY